MKLKSKSKEVYGTGEGLLVARYVDVFREVQEWPVMAFKSSTVMALVMAFKSSTAAREERGVAGSAPLMSPIKGLSREKEPR